MGCKSSSEKTDGQGNGNKEPPDEVKAELKEALVDYHKFLQATCPDHLDPLLKAYLNGCVEVLKIHFRKKADKSVILVQEIANELGEPFASAGKVVDEDYCADDGMLRCYITWLQYKRSLSMGDKNSPGGGGRLRGRERSSSTAPIGGAPQSLDGSFAWDEPDLTYITQQTAIEELGLPSHATFSTYRELLDIFHQTTQHPELHDVFDQLSEGETLLSVDAFANFLRTQGYEKDLQSFARDKIRNSFGGYLTKYNFSTYYSTPRTNSVFDPQRATVVWQDMTQPLTSYYVRTQKVHSMPSVQRAINLGVKCLLFTILQKSDGKLYCIPAPTSEERRSMASPLPEGANSEDGYEDQLADVLCWLKAHAFEGPMHSYPVVLGFPNLDPLLEDEVAIQCTQHLGDALEKGLMFEGASIQDPQFTPAALSNKFLLLASQRALVPFVGFLVADMARDGLGVKVTDVNEGTPAAKATICKDDWLTHVDGTPIANRKQLKAVLQTATLGQELELRKESQETAKITVGGNFPPTADVTTMDKSVFLRLMTDREPDSPSRRDNEFAPWECLQLPKDGGGIFEDHFGLIVDPSNEEEMIVENQRNGVQLIESSTVASRLWADGVFIENARCGYVLKRKPKPTPQRMQCAILTRFQKNSHLKVDKFEANVFGGPNFEGSDGSVTVNTEDELALLVLRFTTHLDDSEASSKPPSSPSSPSGSKTPKKKEKLGSHSGSNGDLINYTPSPVVYTAAVPMHMLRKGYHAIPLRTAEGQTDSVVCLVEREDN